jgi:hypothetical protein
MNRKVLLFAAIEEPREEDKKLFMHMPVSFCEGSMFPKYTRLLTML